MFYLTLAITLLMMFQFYGMKDKLEKDANETKTNYNRKAAEETRRQLNKVVSRNELNRFLKENYLDPEYYKDWTIDNAKNMLIEKSLLTGKVYRYYQ